MVIIQELCHQKVLEFQNVDFSYYGQKVIKNFNFQILERDFVGVLGNNGAGKTTCLKLMVGLLKPQKGQIYLFEQPIRQCDAWTRIGYVPQKNAFNPLFPATVREVVLTGLYNNFLHFQSSKQDKTKLEDALTTLQIEDLAGRKIGQLSGGQQQRVFLARALIKKPDVLILDEPTVGVDIETQQKFFQLIRHMHQFHSLTIIMVTHDLEMIKEVLGEKPTAVNEKLKFYIRHSHDLQDCEQTDLKHSLTVKSKELETK